MLTRLKTTKIQPKITKVQIQELHILLAATGFVAYKQDLMDTACIDGRYPTSSKDLYESEAQAIINHLRNKNNDCDKMRKKVIANCLQAGMAINGRADMPKIYAWVEKYGHAKKHFNKYTYHELTTLVTQAQQMFKTFLKAV